MQVGKHLNAGRDLSEHKKQKYNLGKSSGAAGRTFNFDDDQLKNIKTILNNRVDTDIADKAEGRLANKF